MYVVIAVVYALYKTCIDSNTVGDRQYSSTNDDGSYPSSSPGAGGWNTGNMFFLRIQFYKKLWPTTPKPPHLLPVAASMASDCFPLYKLGGPWFMRFRADSDQQKWKRDIAKPLKIVESKRRER